MRLKSTLAAKNRLEDYLKARKLEVPRGFMSMHYRDLGLDEVDWGIVIGEIQCDTLMILDWEVSTDNFSNATGIVDNLRPVRYNDHYQIYRHMVSLWSEEQRKTISDNASENAWP